jgi:hypothetical protein
MGFNKKKWNNHDFFSYFKHEYFKRILCFLLVMLILRKHLGVRVVAIFQQNW